MNNRDTLNTVCTEKMRKMLDEKDTQFRAISRGVVSAKAQVPSRKYGNFFPEASKLKEKSTSKKKAKDDKSAPSQEGS